MTRAVPIGQDPNLTLRTAAARELVECEYPGLPANWASDTDKDIIASILALLAEQGEIAGASLEEHRTDSERKAIARAVFLGQYLSDAADCLAKPDLLVEQEESKLLRRLGSGIYFEVCPPLWCWRSEFWSGSAGELLADLTIRPGAAFGGEGRGGTDEERAQRQKVLAARLDKYEPRARVKARMGMPMTGKAEAPASELPEWLIGKDAICSVLKQDNDRWRAILRLAKQADPPPIVTQRGGQSRAERTTLCRWWEGVMARRDASSTRNAERRLAGEARHPYGRGGEAAPEVAGGVHRRRAAKGRKT